jgi:ABC-type multidrug transport system fused ATPase/permease subunit
MFTIPYEMIWRKFSKTYKKTDVNVVGIEHVLRFNYQIVFFFLVSSTRYLVPFFKHFELSGEFTLWRKIWDAFKGALFEILFFTLIIVVLAVILLNVVMALFIGFTLVTLIYALVFLAHSMITIPKKLNIHSDIKLSIEYYEYKANKKLGELTKNHEKIISTYYQCQETIKYIDNIEDYMKNKGIKLDDDEKPENEKDDAINNSIDNNINEDENIINEDNNDIKENKNNLEENLINEEIKKKLKKKRKMKK